MPGATPRIDHIPAGVSAVLNHARSLHMPSRLGAIVLLILLLAIFAAGAQAWRLQTSLSHQHQAPAATSSIQGAVPQPTILNKDDTSLDVEDSQGGGKEPLPNGDQNTSPDASSHVSNSVTVNGQSIPLPSDGKGTVHKEITSENGSKTTVDINVDSNSSSSKSSSSMNLNVDSRQSSVNNSE